MAYEPRRRSNVVLNLTPLIDIVFLLLVFFMLTAHFIEDESLAIDLPQAQSSQPAEEDGFVEVQLTNAGEIRLDGETVTEDALEAALRQALEAPDRHSVRLRGDEAGQLGAAVGIIDAARRAGAESLDILTEGAPSAKPRLP